jgi:acyl-CoA hydrolase
MTHHAANPPPGHARIDLARHVRAGDTVVIGQGCGEPSSLAAALMNQRAAIGRFKALLCTVLSDNFRPEHADGVDFIATGITTGTRPLAAAGAVDVITSHYSDLEPLLREGRIGSDVVLLQVSPPGPDGRFSLGATHDYILSAIPRARCVIAEVNHNAPWTHGTLSLRREDLTCIVESDAPLVTAAAPPLGDVELRIGAHVAALVTEHATLQLGIGSIPDAVLHCLADRRGLGFHAGMMSDAVADLIERGAIDNSHKTSDRGKSVTGVLLGTPRLFSHAHMNTAVIMRSPDYTHSAATLARCHRLFAINSAIEVDLTGQVNAESFGGRYLGAIGGQVDFMRGARLSEGGRSVIALTSTHGRSRESRIVGSLNGPVTTARSDADMVVTEWGVAHLRGLAVRQRMRAMVEIADPIHREKLNRAAHAANASL